MKQIIAMGGGGFSMEPDNLALDRYVLRQTQKPVPSVCFLPTASADSESYCLRFLAAFSTFECRPSYMSLFKLPTKDIEGFLLSNDVIYVGGGNTKSMLALWREWGLDVILRKAWEQGVVLAGLSAGAICWFEQGITDSIPGDLTALPCLGLLAGSCCPHYDGEAERRPQYHRLLGEGIVESGYALDDGAAVHFLNDSIHEAVSSRPHARAYYVRHDNGQVTEQPLPIRYLNADTPPTPQQ